MKHVNYSYECGDTSLPHLSELVSDTEDPHKSIILDYLKTNCVITCPGIVRDIISPDKNSGFGDHYTDYVYYWTDSLYYYVENYNIPLPDEFRNHILQNYESRRKRHRDCRLLDSIHVVNNPHLGFRYEIFINKSGAVKYFNNLDCPDGAFFVVNPSDAEYLIRTICSQLFCYDHLLGDKGAAVIDGHNWSIEFYNKKSLAYKSEGHTNEDSKRRAEFYCIVKAIEQITNKDFGLNYMKS